MEELSFLIGAVVVGLISWWVYKDATKRRSSAPVLWAVLVFAFLIIFLPVYLIARPKMPQQSG